MNTGRIFSEMLTCLSANSSLLYSSTSARLVNPFIAIMPSCPNVMRSMSKSRTVYDEKLCRATSNSRRFDDTL